MEAQHTARHVRPRRCNPPMQHYTPPEVWSEILKWLPVKSLLCFRCVCKNWYNLISSSTFIASHLACSTSKPRLLAVNIAQIRPPQRTGSLIYDSGNTSTFIPGLDGIKLLRALRRPNHSLKLVGSINGIVCFSVPYTVRTIPTSVILVNPLVNKYIKLPPPSTSYDRQSIGFGFKASEGDLRVIGFPPLWFPEDTSPDQFAIYSVRQRAWRPLPSGTPSFGANKLSEWQCFVNGAVHWVANIYDQGNGVASNSLLSFDFEEEVFTHMDLPENLAKVSMDYLFPVIYNGMVAVLECGDPFRNIWTLGEYGNVSSWTVALRIYSFARFSSLERFGWIQGITVDGRFLLRGSRSSLYLYDARSKTYDRDLDIKASMRTCLSSPFIESLVFMDDEGGARSLPTSSFDL